MWEKIKEYWKWESLILLAVAAVTIVILSGKLYKTTPEKTEVPITILPEEKYILALSPHYSDAKELGAHIKFVSETFGVSSKVLIAIAFQESSFNTKAINNNDLGIFQLNYIHQIIRKNRPYTIQELTEDWKLNTILAAQYLRECGAAKQNKNLEHWVCYHS